VARRKKTKGTLGVDLSVPTCLKPLVDNKNIMTYIITRCIEDSSDKLYIFVVVSYKKKLYLARFWGAFNGAMTGMHEDFDSNEFQKIINEKGKKGYKIVDNMEITEAEDVYGQAAECIDSYISRLPKITVGSKVPLT